MKHNQYHKPGLIITIFVFLSFSRCSVLNPRPMETGSGRPEITVQSSAKHKVIAEIGGQMFDQGYTMVEEITHKLVYEKEIFQSFGSKVFAGAMSDSDDNRQRVIFNFLSNNNRLRIMVEILTVKVNDQGDHRVNANRHAYPKWQTFLDNIKSKYSNRNDYSNHRSPTRPVTNSARNTSVLEVQKRLTELGYNPGPIDGIMGGKTAAALREFQNNNNLSVTGQINNETLEKLQL